MMSRLQYLLGQVAQECNEIGKHLGQGETMKGWLYGRKLFALGFTKDGQPLHPLYLPKASKLMAYKERYT